MDSGPAGPRSRSTAGNDTDPAVVELEIERCAGSDRFRRGDDACDRVAHHDIAACEQALMAFRAGREPAREIVDLVLAATKKAGHGGKQPRLGFGETGA